MVWIMWPHLRRSQSLLSPGRCQCRRGAACVCAWAWCLRPTPRPRSPSPGPSRTPPSRSCPRWPPWGWCRESRRCRGRPGHTARATTPRVRATSALVIRGRGQTGTDQRVTMRCTLDTGGLMRKRNGEICLLASPPCTGPWCTGTGRSAWCSSSCPCSHTSPPPADDTQLSHHSLSSLSSPGNTDNSSPGSHCDTTRCHRGTGPPCWRTRPPACSWESPAWTRRSAAGTQTQGAPRTRDSSGISDIAQGTSHWSPGTYSHYDYVNVQCVPHLAVLLGVVAVGVLHQLLVRHGAHGVLDVGAAWPAQPGPIAPDLDPDLGAVVGLGQTPLKTRGPVTCRDIRHYTDIMRLTLTPGGGRGGGWQWHDSWHRDQVPTNSPVIGPQSIKKLPLRPADKTWWAQEDLISHFSALCEAPIIVSRAENIVTWHKINEFTRNQTNSCYYSVCNRISRNVQGNRFLLSSFVKCGCQYSDRPSISPLYTPIYFPGVQTKYSPSRPDLGTMSLSLMFIQVLGCKLIGNLLSSHNDYSDSHWSVSRMVVVVHITGSSSSPDMSSLLAGM